MNQQRTADAQDVTALELVDRHDGQVGAPRSSAVVDAVQTSPAVLLHMAVQQGADLDRLERLMALQERWEANEARKAFHTAMAAFHAEPITIGKDKHVDYTSKSGIRTQYDHATLGNIVKVVVPRLGMHDLSHSWEPARTEGGRVTVTCRVTHKAGHTESVTLDAPLDDSGGKNNIQALGSAITYLQRYTLIAILGLATEDQDDDGAAAGMNVAIASEKILDGLLSKLDAAKTDADCLALWRIGRDSLEATQNIEGVNELRQRVAEKRTSLKVPA